MILLHAAANLCRLSEMCCVLFPAMLLTTTCAHKLLCRRQRQHSTQHRNPATPHTCRKASMFPHNTSDRAEGVHRDLTKSPRMHWDFTIWMESRGSEKVGLWLEMWKFKWDRTLNSAFSLFDVSLLRLVVQKVIKFIFKILFQQLFLKWRQQGALLHH